MVGFLAKVNEAFDPVGRDVLTWGARVGDVVSFRVDADHLSDLAEFHRCGYQSIGWKRLHPS